MKYLYRLPLSAAILTMTLAVSLPSAAGAKSEGHGKQDRDRSSEARGGHSGKREYSRGRGGRASGERRYAQRSGDRKRYRDSDQRSGAPTYRARTQYRHGGPGYSNYCSRPCYTESFQRPRFVHRSGFSLGIVIGSVPSHGYRYFDPYCDMGFSNLDAYYEHCDDHGHADVIQVLDVRSGYPIASCAYRGGDWVVDDCN